jgi:uncharacterized repeat protein (TIGR03803 family)
MRTQARETSVYRAWLLPTAAMLGWWVALPVSADFTTLYRSPPWAGDSISGFAEAADGGIFATTVASGSFGMGTILRSNATGQLEVVHSFSGGDGAAPSGGVVLGPDGALYGTTSLAGPNDLGTAFRVTPDGNVATLHAFTIDDGGSVHAPLLLADDCNLYGVGAGDLAALHDQYWTPRWPFITPNGGSVFRMSLAGDVQVLHTFTGLYGVQPLAGLMQASDGALYGSTSAVVTNSSPAVNVSWGSLFRIALDGAFTPLHVFDGYDGGEPVGQLVEAVDGDLLGVTARPNRAEHDASSTIFRLARTGSGALSTLYTFPLATDVPLGIARAEDGSYLGTTKTADSDQLGSAFRMTMGTGAGSTVSPLNAFTTQADGRPSSALVMTARGGFLGATQNTIYQLATDGTTHTIAARRTGDLGVSLGASRLTAGRDGALYGFGSDAFFRFTARAGMTVLHTWPAYSEVNGSFATADGTVTGISAYGGSNGQGSIFRITPDGEFSEVASFDRTTGSRPITLLEGRDGNLYGTTYDGGTQDAGTVFRLDAAGVLTAIHHFGANGDSSEHPMTQAPDGTLYFADSANPWFSIYELTPDGIVTLLHTLDRNAEGTFITSLAFGADGYLYATTSSDGPLGRGTLFRMTKEGASTVLYAFGTDPLDGDGPTDLQLSADGIMYGTTGSTVFRVTTAGALATVAHFPAIGRRNLSLGPDGAFYGVALYYQPNDDVLGAIVRVTLDE